MDFFEKLGKKATETYKTAAEKTNKLASDTKLKVKINDCKSKINDIYEEIGKKVYQKYTLDGNLNIKEDIEGELKRIDELVEQIQNYEKQRLELSDIKECIKCKEKLDKTAKFCSKCGAEQPEEEIKEVEVVEIKEDVKNEDEIITSENIEEENKSTETNE